MNPSLISLLLLTPTFPHWIFKTKVLSMFCPRPKLNVGSWRDHQLEFKPQNHDPEKNIAQMLPTHSSPKFIRHHTRLIESFQVLQACSARWKNQRQATGFLITHNPRNILETRRCLTHCPWACFRASHLTGFHAKRGKSSKGKTQVQSLPCCGGSGYLHRAPPTPGEKSTNLPSKQSCCATRRQLQLGK